MIGKVRPLLASKQAGSGRRLRKLRLQLDGSSAEADVCARREPDRAQSERHRHGGDAERSKSRGGRARLARSTRQRATASTAAGRHHRGSSSSSVSHSRDDIVAYPRTGEAPTREPEPQYAFKMSMFSVSCNSH